MMHTDTRDRKFRQGLIVEMIVNSGLLISSHGSRTNRGKRTAWVETRAEILSISLQHRRLSSRSGLSAHNLESTKRSAYDLKKYLSTCLFWWNKIPGSVYPQSAFGESGRGSCRECCRKPSRWIHAAC